MLFARVSSLKEAFDDVEIEVEDVDLMCTEDDTEFEPEQWDCRWNT